MTPFELITPGVWLNHEDRDWCLRMGTLIDALKRNFFESDAALNLFIEVQRESRLDPDRERVLFVERRRHHRELIGRQHDNVMEAQFLSDIEFKRAKWMEGRIPMAHSMARVFICARAFLYAADGLYKLIGVMSKEPGAPVELAVIHADFNKQFPALVEVRNSAHHPEDRIRGLGRNGKPIAPAPIQTDAIHASVGGVLVVDQLDGSRYGTTMADGHYGQIDVSPDSMAKLQVIVQGVIDAFQWKPGGPPQHEPAL